MSGDNTVISRNEGGGFDVLPELQPYIGELGNMLYQLLRDPMTNPGRFAHETPLGLLNDQDISSARESLPGLQQQASALQQQVTAAQEAVDAAEASGDQTALATANATLSGLTGQLNSLNQQIGTASFISGTGPTSLQQSGLDFLGNLQQTGMPTPGAETTALGWLNDLPGQVGQQVPMSDFWNQAKDSAGNVISAGQNLNPTEQGALGRLDMAGGLVPESNRIGAGLTRSQLSTDVSGANNPLERESQDALRQFSQGDIGDSPAVRSAIQGLESNIVPMLGNRAASMGLANSGNLLSEIGQAYAQQLTPLYQQGMAQQQQAAGQLGQMGQNEVQRQIQALQAQAQNFFAAGQNQQGLQTEQLLRNLQGAQIGLGAGQNLANRQMGGYQNQQNMFQNMAGSEQQLGSDALTRMLGSVLQGGQLLTGIGQNQTNRFLQPAQMAFQGGQVQRDISNEMRNFMLEPYLRQREMALSFLNPGSVSIATTPPNQTKTTSRSSGMSK